MSEPYVLTDGQKVEILLLHRSLILAQQNVKAASDALEQIVGDIMKENKIQGQLDLGSLTFIAPPAAVPSTPPPSEG